MQINSGGNMPRRRTNLPRAILLSGALVIAAGMLPTSVRSADFATGLEAYTAGDYGTAASEWRPLAEQGDPSAQFNMGLLYDTGFGVPLGTAQAALWYRKAAEQGLASAQYNLAVLYQMGRGLPYDLERAFFWLSVAALTGDSDTQARAASARDRLEDGLEGGVSARIGTEVLEKIQTMAETHRLEEIALPRDEAVPYLALSRRDVRSLQQHLVNAGYDIGKVDGIAGPRTRRAMGDYLDQRGGGELEPPFSRELLRRLLVSPHSE